MWSTLLFGFQQSGNAVASIASGSDATKTPASFGIVSNTIETKLEGGFKSLYQIGESFQRTTVDLAYDALMLETLSFRGMVKTGLNLIQQSANVLKILLPGQETGLVLEEFQNKLTAFEWFEHVDTKLSLPLQTDTPPVLLLRRTERLDSYSRIWATEGIGFLFAERCLSQRSEPQNLLGGASVKGVAENNFIALHAGMGLSLAHRFLKRLNGESSFRELPELLQAHITLYKNNSQSGYAEIGIETLGLAARNLYPHLLLSLDDALKQIDEDYVAYFWHGAGRAIYFAPTGLFPMWDASWSSVLATQEEPPHESGRLNALTGWIFALTLVNIRQPEILAAYFKRYKHLFVTKEAVVSGISSAIIVWQDSTQDNSCLESFLNYAPTDEDVEFSSQWRELIQRPTEAALRDYRAKPKNERQPKELFRFRSREIKQNTLKYEAHI